MANIQHLRVVFLNEFFHTVEKNINRSHFERWEDPNEEILDGINCAIEHFKRKMAKAHAKNKTQCDRANHLVTNIEERTNTNNYNRLSSKRRKAKKNETTI